MKTIFALLLTGAVVLCPNIGLAQQETGRTQLHSIDQSGIRGVILFLDTGSPSTGLIVSGFATGLDPAAGYISLRYDARSVPGGPHACEPSAFNNLTFPQMFVGSWTVNVDGTGTLFAVKTTGTYTPLSEIQNISIRRVPGGILQACGVIATQR